MEKEQIVRALECCAEQEVCGTCLFEGKCGGMEYLLENALSLIREQEKMIEELENICNSYALQYGTATDKEVFLKKERADTVRKMQEKLKTVFYSESKFMTQTHGYIRYIVDEIAKGVLEENT